MIEYWTTWEWKTIPIDSMSTEHLLKAIDVIKYRSDDWFMEYDREDEEQMKVAEEEWKKLERQYQAMHNELVVRLARKFLLDNEDKLPDLPF